MSRTECRRRPSDESARGGGESRSDEVKYMIMTFGSAEEGLATMGKEWMVEMIQFMHKLDDDLRKSGELVSEAGLADGSQAKTVRFQNGIPVPTDGPFAESKESLVGYWNGYAGRRARAIQIASRTPSVVQ